MDTPKVSYLCRRVGRCLCIVHIGIVHIGGTRTRCKKRSTRGTKSGQGGIVHRENNTGKGGKTRRKGKMHWENSWSGMRYKCGAHSYDRRSNLKPSTSLTRTYRRAGHRRRACGRDRSGGRSCSRGRARAGHRGGLRWRETMSDNQLLGVKTQSRHRWDAKRCRLQKLIHLGWRLSKQMKSKVFDNVWKYSHGKDAPAAAT